MTREIRSNTSKEYRKLYEQWTNSEVYKEIYKDKSIGEQMKIED